MLTDEVITGLPVGSSVQPNAELENKEHLKFPDGEIQRVAGNPHKKGGVKMYIPDGTKILSDKGEYTETVKYYKYLAPDPKAGSFFLVNRRKGFK